MFNRAQIKNGSKLQKELSPYEAYEPKPVL